jgi:glycosyltransferase involved in cell wall biosynthesis
MRRKDDVREETVQTNLSIVIPVLNEEANLKPLYSELKEALEALGRSYEIVFVDDGSTDSSAQVLAELHEADDPEPGPDCGHHGRRPPGCPG